MTILYVLATISGIFLGLGSLPQAIKIFRNKSAGDISVTTYTITTIGGVIWVLYGIEIHNPPIIIPNIIGVVLSTVILVGWFLYGRSKK